ncbi:MAG: 2-hydroxyglutaryl-CoA dehydratase [Ruminococcaceae bacterium]|nr:2-hydroxyglutaryl-CoA dehydratase [Oscillospiraceae bacterium]
MAETTYPRFTEEMRKTYTILVPTMLPMHFRFIIKIMGLYGYRAELLETSGPHIAETGVKYVHNDTCYPAILVIGQFIDALQSGKYDPHKVALMISQTGGGCRASNYISLLRKALIKAGFDYVPVLSFNIAGLEKDSGFKLTLPMLHRMAYGVLYGDLLMLLKNQCQPYEIKAGESEALALAWTDRLVKEQSERRINYRRVKENYRAILRDFSAIECREEQRVKVGIVGEIFVKYSPLGNNNLEDFLLSEGAEVVVPGLTDFALYCVYNTLVDRELYGRSKLIAPIYRLAYRILTGKQEDLIRIVREESRFTPPGSFRHTCTLTRDYLNVGVKMGEGWLLTAEMLELIEGDVRNIVCTQPFGCLPNHIVGKGMMKPIKSRNPGVNIVAIDYDPGATRINQENRIKLMLANAKENLAEVKDTAETK